MTSNNNKMNCVIDRGTGEVRDELPLFLRGDGEEILDKRRKELEVYVSLLNASPDAVMKQTFITIIPDVLKLYDDDGKYNKWWKDEKTIPAFRNWIKTNKHKVNGKYGNWSAGFLGSRWADTDLNGMRCRLAFYSRKLDADNFPEEMDKALGKEYNYILAIDPTN
jgi:hypothetical protein